MAVELVDPKMQENREQPSEDVRVPVMATTLYDLYQQWVRDGRPKRAGQDA